MQSEEQRNLNKQFLHPNYEFMIMQKAKPGCNLVFRQYPCKLVNLDLSTQPNFVK